MIRSSEFMVDAFPELIVYEKRLIKKIRGLKCCVLILNNIQK